MIAQPRKNIMDMFIDGARRGFTIATTSLLPNVVMAFVIIQALKVTGLLDIVGKICEPIMGPSGRGSNGSSGLGDEYGGRRGRLRQPGRRRHAQRPRCYHPAAGHLSDGQSGAKHRSLPGDRRREPKILSAYYYSLRH